MSNTIDLGHIHADVIKKNIKHLHLSVRAPEGQVRISAPMYMTLDTIRAFAISKLHWIKNQQRKILAQEREPVYEYLDGESHYVWGKPYLLRIIKEDMPLGVELQHPHIALRLRSDAATARKQAVLVSWYREQLLAAIPPLLEKWEPLMGVHCQRFFIQRMKTRWGSCNPVSRNIRLNTELAKKPPECLEYVVVHELIHLIEPSHNARFYRLMDQFMPNWRQLKDTLNRLPIGH